MVASRDNFPLLAELLAEQQRLDTPVAQFSAAHDAGTVARLPPQLIPLTAPKAGEQYAFEVDLDSCTGCKSCVAACHSLNGLDDNETWRDVGLLISSRRAKPFTQTVTTACHHCADPACLNGCPVLAYEKDPLTGIVRHLDDQCIGCSYCILKCPYDVPKFSERLGIVRKCDMCHSRLAAGEAPACAQACPTHAIKIVTVTIAKSTVADAAVETAEKKETATTAPTPCSFLPGAPDPAYTQPTTRYITKRKLPENLIAADASATPLQPAHWPLVVMLTLMPLAVGLSAATALAPVENRFPLALATVIAGALGLGASVFHLGQPMRAWRIFLGWRTSWLSREAMLFGVWFAFAAATLVLPFLAVASSVIGVIGLFCSAMIYIDTRRSFWAAAQTFPRFLGAAAIFGLAVFAPRFAAFALLAKIAWESRTLYGGGVSARLQNGPLTRASAARVLCGLFAAVTLLAAPGWMAWTLLFAGELAERYIFFRAVDAPKMPGMPS